MYNPVINFSFIYCFFSPKVCALTQNIKKINEEEKIGHKRTDIHYMQL